MCPSPKVMTELFRVNLVLNNAALTGKYLSEFGLKVLNISKNKNSISIMWWVVLLSAALVMFYLIVLCILMLSHSTPLP
jgi:hypothetical protein